MALAAALAAVPSVPAARPADATGSFVPGPAYWRPVVVQGKAFPVARSNFFSLLEFVDDWHAVRLRLIDGTWEPVGVHEGIDISAEAGTPVLSMTAGVVENVGWLFYSGTRIGVRGTDGRYYLYAHLSEVAPGIAEGTPVRPGRALGRVGNTGYGPPGHRDEFPAHLHFGIEAGSEWVNPYPALVSLYRAAVERGARTQTALDDLAARGNRTGWDARATDAFTRFGLR